MLSLGITEIRSWENTFRVRWWKIGTFQILVSLAKALSRKQASLELSGGPGHFIATLWASFPGGSRCQNQEKDYKEISQLLVIGDFLSRCSSSAENETGAAVQLLCLLVSKEQFWHAFSQGGSWWWKKTCQTAKHCRLTFWLSCCVKAPLSHPGTSSTYCCAHCPVQLSLCRVKLQPVSCRSRISGKQRPIVSKKSIRDDCSSEIFFYFPINSLKAI